MVLKDNIPFELQHGAKPDMGNVPEWGTKI
jgi:hypothetical protein